MGWRVSGEAHGSRFDERGFTTWTDATDYASDVMDGDLDSTILVEPEQDATGRAMAGFVASVLDRGSIEGTRLA
jgi:hypothetical protein